jgi:ribosomal protein S18 acetylase RimI-like enzyme
MPTVCDAVPSDFGNIGWTLGQAFADDPVWRYLVPTDRPWQSPAARFFEVEASSLGRSGRGRVLRTDRDEGAALWAAPGTWRPRPIDLTRQTPSAVRLFGSRLVLALRTLARIERAHPHQPHWYLAMLGTAPAHQGRGVGSSLISPILRHCDHEGIPAYLESSKEANLAFYRRHGFVERDPLFLDPDGPKVWPMWREPRPPDPSA